MDITKINKYYVLVGVDFNYYANMVGNPETDITSFNELDDFLDNELWNKRGGCDPLWDYPLEELEDGVLENDENIYVELTDGEETRYYESFTKIIN